MPGALAMIQVASAAIVVPVNGRPALLLAQRRDTSTYAGCWESPGGKVNPGETFEEALHREIHEELGDDVNIRIEALIADFNMPNPSLYLKMFGATLQSGVPKPLAAKRLRYFHLHEVPMLQLMPANKALLTPILTWANRWL